MHDKRIAITCLGSSSLLYKCAQAVKEHYGDMVDLTVIDVNYSPMNRKYAVEFGEVDKYKSKQEIFDWLESVSAPMFLLSINNPYVIPKNVCDNENLTLINLHHALLPKHPGRNAEAWTIYDMDQYGGITWHYITPGIDDGAIIFQKKTRIKDDTTSLKLLRECEALALDSLKEELLPLENLKKANARKQENNKERATLAKDVPNGGRLELSWEINKISAFLRALDYGAANVLGRAKITLNDQNYFVRKYKIENTEDQANSIITQKTPKGETVIITDNGTLITLLLN